jgi:CRP/FNR family transcriptional regulator, dissimilatory nitrate respiration regulator
MHATAQLAELPIFRRTPRPVLAELAQKSRIQDAPAGAVLARRGERLPGLMVVGYGLVKLTLRGDGERVMRLVGPGETFGEAALFLEQPLQVDVSAVSDTGLIIVPADALLLLFDRDPRFARGLLASLCQRLHAIVADFEAATVHRARERLAAYLGSLAEPGQASAQLPAAKGVIASRLGMTKETFSRLLRAFIDEGLIGVAKREIRLLDRAALDAVARGGAPSGPGPDELEKRV